MTKLVRSAVLTNYAFVARSLGLDPYRLVEKAGLTAACLMEQDLKIPVSSMCRLLEISADLSGTENFGLRLAEMRRLSVLGHLGIALREAPTFREALGIVDKYVPFHIEALRTLLHESDGYASIRQYVVVEQRVGTRQAAELALGMMVRVMRLYLGEEWMPSKMSFSHTAPADLGLHRKLFGASLEFGQAFNAIICKSRDLDMPSPSSDPIMARYALRQLEMAHIPGQDSTEAEVRQWIHVSLASGNCSVEHVTKHLGLEIRTLHRRLMRNGVTFSDLVNQIRVELCERYLAQPDRKLSDIATLLGFSRLSGFSRWHQKQFGCSASTARQKLSAPP